MRGYHAQLENAEGYEMGKVNSFYPVPKEQRHVMLNYMSIFPPMWAMDFAIGWRDLDRGFDLEPSSSTTRR